ncbi:LysR family transcriptional regulator [Frankia sp. AiPs1]|uniref:LysR family transcriptional regulator n=1 Tax=Frankia sp. AiPs1 TaxID=573493 RepID=UPI002043877F|nr:LysR family transcriptional regulator [Frankia sp. AiPs1]MCM3920182.1 LysR family transcriptional regulator [Frankia sp. AiPs1]
MSIDIHNLKCFIAVAEEASFSRAAERLHLTLSPVSRAVKDLERELEADLFVRSYRRVELTPAGRVILRRARSLIDEWDQLRSIAHAGTSPSVRIVRIGGTHLAPPVLFDRVLTVAGEALLGNQVEARFAASSELLPAVRSGALDLALVHPPVEVPELDTLMVARYRFLIAMRSDDPFARAAELDLAELAHRTVVLVPPKLQPLAVGRLHRHLAGAGIADIVHLSENDSILLATHVRRNRSLTLTLAPGAGGAASIFVPPDFAVVPLRDDGFTFSVGVTWRRDRVESEVEVAAMVSAMREVWEGRTEVF